MATSLPPTFPLNPCQPLLIPLSSKPLNVTTSGAALLTFPGDLTWKHIFNFHCNDALSQMMGYVLSLKLQTSVSGSHMHPHSTDTGQASQTQHVCVSSLHSQFQQDRFPIIHLPEQPHTLHTQTHTCSCTHTHSYTHRCTDTHIFMHSHTHIHSFTHTYAHTQMHTQTHIHTIICTHAQTHVHTIKHSHTDTHRHTHTLTQTYTEPVYTGAEATITDPPTRQLKQQTWTATQFQRPQSKIKVSEGLVTTDVGEKDCSIPLPVSGK